MSHTIGQAKEDAQESNSNSNQSPQDAHNSGESSSKPVSGLSDADYEFLFNQLLEGIAHGWHDRRIIKFFKQLGDRGQQADWIAWLDRLRGKLLKLPVESKRQLGTLMIRLGELTQSAVEVKQIGAASHSLGRELLFGNNSPAIIWEYVGPDLSVDSQAVETEQELSERLPSDFEALAETEIERDETDDVVDLSVEQEQSNQESDLNLGIEEIIDLLVPGENAAPESEISLESEVVSGQQDTTSLETLVSADELWADDLPSEPQVDNESQPEIDLNPNLDLDLKPNLAQNLTDLDSSYDEEFEFESESQASTSEVSGLEPEVKVVANSEPEQSQLTTGGLSAELQAFELEPDPEPNSTEELTIELEPELNLELSEEADLEKLESISADSTSPESPREPSSSKASTPELDESSLELIESWFNLGLKQVSAGEYDKAIASWDKALTINANLPEAWHNRGSALGRLGNYEAAVKSFQNALEIDPDNYQAWNDRAHALYQLQEWSGAVESWSQAIKIMPGNHLFWYNRGCSLEQLAKWTEAIASYEKALEIKPDFQPGRSRYINLVADNSRPN